MPHVHTACVGVTCQVLTSVEIVSLSVEHVNQAHCLTPHVAAQALQALTAPLAHTLASFQALTSSSSSVVCEAAV